MKKIAILAAGLVAFCSAAYAVTGRSQSVTVTASCGAANDPDPTSIDAGLALVNNYGVSPSDAVQSYYVTVRGNVYGPLYPADGGGVDGGVEKISFGQLLAWRYSSGGGWARWPTGDLAIDGSYNADGGTPAQTWTSKEIAIANHGPMDRIHYTTKNLQTVADGGSISITIEGEIP